MSFLDIARTIAILAFGVVSFWVIYRLMKNADENEENKENDEDK